jgi:hypothetical protein
MGPPSYDSARCFRELFEHPDAWQETRSVIDVLQSADHQLERQFTDTNFARGSRSCSKAKVTTL